MYISVIRLECGDYVFEVCIQYHYRFIDICIVVSNLTSLIFSLILQNTSGMYSKDPITQNMELERPEDKYQLQKEPHAKRQVQAAKTSGEHLMSGEGQYIV